MPDSQSMLSGKNSVQLRQAPEDGHVLLLFEAKEDQRVFSDYPNLIECLDSITELYERSRIDSGQEHTYTVDQLWSWLDSFLRLEVFIFDKEIARYKHINREEFKELFVEQLQKLSDS